MFYVYELVSSLNGEVFYVGKGSGQRMYKHRINAMSGSDRSVHRKIRSIISKNGDIIYNKVALFDNEYEAFALEKQLILDYGRKDLGTGTLCNLSEGGEGCSGISEETRAKLRTRRQATPEQRSTWIKAHYDKNLALYGTRRTPETLEKASKARKGKKWSEDKRNSMDVARKPNAVKVSIIDQSQQCIAQFPSISSAAHYLQVQPSTIWSIFKGRTTKASNGKMYPCKTCKGYTFRFSSTDHPVPEV